jgi:photoactive yellow protein
MSNTTAAAAAPSDAPFELVDLLDESGLPDVLDPRGLDGKSDEELDTLPYGVICLDAAGTILRYNQAEARLARLDKRNVLGRAFFRDVAPCTATAEFEGRVRAFLAPGNAERSARFPFVFDFKFGAQEVEVELVRPPTPGRLYLLVNRTRFLPARPVPEQTKAPLQAELAPDEAKQGVARDANQQRAVQVSGPLFYAMRHTWDRVAPKAWGMFCLEWGFRWGRLFTVDLEVQCIERTGKGLREVPVGDAVAMLARALGRQGWGRLGVDFAAGYGSQSVLVTLDRSALAESVGPSDVGRCQLLSGLLRAVFSYLSGKVLVVREVACQSQGHARCAFVVAPQERKADLDAAVDASGGDVLKVLGTLGTGARR